MNPDAVWLILASALTVLAMAWFALALPSHWRQVRGLSDQPHRLRLRLCAWITLALSASACLRADHASMAILVWVLLIAVAAVVVGMTLSYRPGWLALLAIGPFRASRK